MNWYLKVLQNYAVFTGRARRKEYWMFVLFNAIISYGLQIIFALSKSYVVYGLLIVYSLGVLLPSLAVGVRRMHDINKSGWFILIPFYNIYLCCVNGDTGENQYESDPKSDGNEIDQIGNPE